MPAVPARVLAVPVPRVDEPDPVPEKDAEERMVDPRLAFSVLHERVTAVARVLRSAMARRDFVHVMAEEPAEVSHALGEPRRVAVRIRVQEEQERMAAADARVLGMPVPDAYALVGVMAQETGQCVPDPDDAASVLETVGAAARAPAARDLERPVVNGMSPDEAEQSTEHRHLPALQGAFRGKTGSVNMRCPKTVVTACVPGGLDLPHC